ncbi:hypothetical protein [Nocardia huaxiensis]|uniref:Uncharacterized protein n=1 Tax=Nocardia huaxiensis TaxID=2755382 RepID=A0A7D6ZN51_9NOCA|nr:hypothetical protein [Nocardia huaxiensis]QLY31363.1 hypothetical protein H0264_03085 [Nocardia huaxiensis]UFS94906.1 hypothetical protein LPY97_29920 [Nocardia huaxiensis]
MNIIKSIGAVVAGFAVTAITSSAVDAVLESSRYLPSGHIYAATPVVLSVILYRTILDVLGGYVAARLAPAHPMRHALTLGGLGTVGAVAAAVATWNMEIGPHWYALSVAAVGLPAAWLGGKLFTRGRTGVPVAIPA